MKPVPFHIINENDHGQVAICQDSFTYLLTFKDFQLTFSPWEMPYLKSYLVRNQNKFQWFNTLLDTKALINIDALGIDLILTKPEMEQMIALLTETQLVIESRLLTLPKVKSE